MRVSVKDIASIIDGTIEGDLEAVISGFGKIEDAGAGEITFYASAQYERFLYASEATAVIVPRDFQPSEEINTTLIKVDDVYGKLGLLLGHFNPETKCHDYIDPSAAVHETLSKGENVFIGAGAVIEADAVIGENVMIHPQVYVGKGVKIGNGVTLHPGVKIYWGCEIGDNVSIHANTVIGSDGFGFSRDAQGNYIKIPQVGNVVIENDVEIGSNVSIDRATLGSTRICRGVKLDNLIQIGHNVVIDENTVIAAQAGVAGSTRIGKSCLIGGQVGIAGHIEIADGTMIQAQSGIASSVKQENSKLYGYPAIDYNSYLRAYANFKRLPNMAKDIARLRKDMKIIQENHNNNEEENN